MVIASACLAGPIPFTINLSENVVVTGTPRIQLDIGGVTRYATYTGGSGTSALTFSYPIVAPDFDRNGISIISPIDLNGGTIKDLNGNNATLTFTPPNTSGVLVQSYQTAFTTSPIDSSNEAAASFNITGAPSGATYNYTITSSGGAGSVTGSGTISADPQPVTGVNVSGLPFGTLTASVTVTNATGTGNAKTGTVAGSWVAPLDALPSPASAFSVRRLLTSYTGPLMQIRRSSDNTTQDIGTSFAGNLNTATLTTFCGANSCYVSKWYDQSGNARDAVQATLGNQPRIVNAGTIESRNSRPAVKFLGVGYNLKTGSFTAFTGGISLIAVAKVDVDVAYNALISKTQSNQPAPLDMYNNIIYVGNGIGNNGFTGATTPFLSSVSYSVWSYVVANTGVGNFFINGAANGAIGATPYNDTGSPIVIGSRNDGATNLNGIVGEGILFPSTLSSTHRQALENNQKIYFGTP